jgi:hypothetical protein
MKRAALCGVATGPIRVKNTGDLRQLSIVACGMPHHVARAEANTAAIDALRHPICSDCHLLPPLNPNLHLPKGHHLTPLAVLLTRAAPITYHYPNDLHHNTGRMKRPGAFATGAGTATTSAGAVTSAVAGEHSFNAFTSLTTGAFDIFATAVAGNTPSMPLPPLLPAPSTYLPLVRVRHRLSRPFLPPPWAQQQLPQDSLRLPG